MPKSIGVAIIARNVEKTIGNCIKSFADDVDDIVVVMAGESTDKTRELALAASPKVRLFDFEWIDDFAAARNFSFSKLNTEWVLWVDADDEVYLPENLKVVIEESPQEVGAIWLPYHYAMDEFGNVTTLYERERLMCSKFGWIWKGRIHETASPLAECKYIRSDKVIIRHNHLAGPSRHERNFRILEIINKEDPEDKRIWLYLGHQNFAAQNWMKATEWYLKFATDKDAIAIERFQAMCYCSKAMRMMRDRQAIDVALMAIELFPNYKDGYLELAHSCAMVGDFDKAIHWVSMSEVKDIMIEPPPIIFINPLEYTFTKFMLLSDCYMNKGNFAIAREMAVKAYEVRPLEDLKNHINFIRDMEARNSINNMYKTLAMELLKNKEIVKLEHLIKSTPYWLRDLPDYDQLQSGAEHYLSKVEDKPEILVNEDKSVVFNIANAVNPKEKLEEIEKEHDHITIIAPLPEENRKQINTYSLRDMEDIIQSKPGRHVLNLQREQNRIICEYDKSVPDNLIVRMFLGQGPEYWSPKTINEVGCGGSETSAALVAKEMAKSKCQPFIYAMDTQVWDGVIYRHYSKYNPSAISCHLFISSRQPQVFNDEINALQKWLWVHDIHCREFLSPEVASQLDVIVALSKWHAGHLKRVYPFLKDSEIIDMDNSPLTYEDNWTAHKFYEDATLLKVPRLAIIGDGIDTSRYAQLTEERKRFRFLWCSSPDRGLEELLNLWPLLKEKMPEAELKIFYGWEYFDQTLWIPEQRAFKERIRKLIQQDGVKWVGRIGQLELAKEQMRADAVIYPPPHSFRETYGIAFLEAQAAGMICFYRQNGALGETIGDRGVALRIDMTPEEIAEVISTTLHNTEKCDILRQNGRDYAMKRDWSVQAEKMLNLYKEVEVSYAKDRCPKSDSS